MNSKFELTRSQLETILRMINDVNLNANKTTGEGKKSSKNEEKNAKKISNLSKKRSYSAINLKNVSSNDELINESFRKSIANLMNESTKQEETKFPAIRSSIRSNEVQNKLKRNKSLIELKREKWQKERDELKDSDSWYEKFDSFKKKPIDRSRSQPNILNPIQNYDDNLLFDQSVSRLFSPVSNFDDESIALSNTYTAPHSQLGQLNNQLNHPLNSQLNSNQYIVDNQFMNYSTNLSPNETFNQPRRSFHRYAHQFNNVNILEKRRKQQEYQGQLEAQLFDKKRLTKLAKHQEMLDDRRLEEKIQSDQAEMRKEFEIDHKGEFLNNEFSLMKRKEEIIKGRRERKAPNDLERLEIKSKELAKVFKEASTQTDNQMNKETLNRPEVNRQDELRKQDTSKFNASTQANELFINKWSTDSTFHHHTILQPVKFNRSALLKTSQKNSKPKWTKQVLKDEDNKTSILPKLPNQKASQLSVRKRWNS